MTRLMVIVELDAGEADATEVWEQLKADAAAQPGWRESGTGMTLETLSMTFPVRPVTS